MRPDVGTGQEGDESAAELQAALDSVILVDGSANARLVGTGPDLLGLLQRLSTGDVAGLGQGQGGATVLTTNKGRIVQRLFVCHLGEVGVLLLGGVDGATVVLEHLRRYTFAEDTGLSDVTATTALFVLAGPRADEVLKALGVTVPAALESHPVRIGDVDAHVLGTDGVSTSGFALLCPVADAEVLRAAVAAAVEAAGGRATGVETLEAVRILRGLGAHGHELTERYNPLEAGQRDAVSFTKGCYVGQEVVARLENYDKVSRTLLGIEFNLDVAPPSPDTPLLRDGREVGRVTSAVIPAGFDRGVGLASVKHRDAAAGDLTIGNEGAEIRLVGLPFPEAPGDTP